MAVKKLSTPECHHCQARFKSVFCDLHGEELDALNLQKGCNTFKKGQEIFKEGFFPKGLFCINSGKIKISQLGNEGKEQIVRFAKEGDVIGYRALLSGEKYSGSAKALAESSVCFIPRDTFFTLIEKNTNLSMGMLKLISHDLKEAEHKITNLAQKPNRERLAEALLFLKETYGFENDGATINVILSREEISNLVGTATETTIRLLSEFKKDKLIDFVGKKIRFLNTKELIRTAEIFD
jgi:CRP/FNR family transcriptional regulator